VLTTVICNSMSPSCNKFLPSIKIRCALRALKKRHVSNNFKLLLMTSNQVVDNGHAKLK
jgi:hypothetical protein